VADEPPSESADYEHNPWPGDPDYDDAVNLPPPAVEPPTESRIVRCLDPDCPVRWAFKRANESYDQHWHPRPHGPELPA